MDGIQLDSKATEPLRGGALFLTTKLPLIFTTKLLNSHILMANSDVMFSTIWYHLYNLKKREKHSWRSVTFGKDAGF